jgi:hypothetical protein
MNGDYFDNIVNQIIWNYIPTNQVIIYSCPDHTYSWAPQGYLLQVYIRKDTTVANLQTIKQQLSCCIQQLTGLKTSKIKIQFNKDDCLSELK